MRPPIGYVIALCANTIILLSAGGVLLISPRLFVKQYKRIYKYNFYSQRPEWGASIISWQGRLLGALMLAFGAFCLYALLQMFGVL